MKNKGYLDMKLAMKQCFIICPLLAILIVLLYLSEFANIQNKFV